MVTGRRPWLVAVAAVVLVGGCSAPRMPLQGYDTHPEGSPAGVLLDGVLQMGRESPCVLLKPIGEAPIGLLWPSGYSATFDPLRVYDERGEEVASEGLTVTLSGEMIAAPSASCRTSSLFEVDQILKRDVPSDG